MISQFDHIIRQLCAPDCEARLVADLRTTSSQDLNDIWHWNADVPAPVDACVHDLIAESIKCRPGAPAIHAWDGELSYEQVDELSTRLAHELVHRGIGPECFVPVFFEKSMWTPVAMLAVMKAGGASVALDINQPEERLRSIVGQVAPLLILASPSNKDLARRLADCEIVVVSTKDLETLERRSAPRFSEVRSHNALCVLFTSGSTGVPKGVVLTHANFSSALAVHSQTYRLHATSRVFDFASYSFDFAWANLLVTFFVGACLCIPSEIERQSDLERSIRKYRSTFAFFTPSLAKTLQNTVFESIRTLVVGGESLSRIDAIQLSARTHLVNIYGPAECTIFVTAASGAVAWQEDSYIGKGVMTNTWVVDTESDDALAVFGAVGELWLEGPLVGRGYLNSPEKTAAAFVEDPPWLLRGGPDHPGRRGRLYRTGDLVRYNEDGSLTFVGRKDNQVKIRGQRVELGEVEQHVLANLVLDSAAASSEADNTDGQTESESLKRSAQVVADVVTPNGSDRPMLVVFVHLAAHAHTSEKEHASAVKHAVAGLEERLATQVPVYMVPSACIPVAQMPMTATGKIDRRYLRQTYAHSLDQFEIQRALPDTPRNYPTTSLEHMLQSIWASVLNLPIHAIGIDDDFLRLGGDSITAMQVSAAARARHVSTSINTVMKLRTIKMIARSSVPFLAPDRQAETISSFSCTVDGGQSFELSPIQRLYFEYHEQPFVCFDQCFMLLPNRAISYESLQSALTILVERHCMLRARFHFDTNRREWLQYIGPPDNTTFKLISSYTHDDTALSLDIAACRASLDITRGPLVSAALLGKADRPLVFLSIHHLVVDFMSWRILLAELETLLESRSLPPAPTTSFPEWVELQSQYAARNLSPSQSLQFNLQAPSLDFWGLRSEQVGKTDYISYPISLSETASSKLSNLCSDRLQARPLEVMIGLLIYSFASLFSDRPLPPIFSEGHGREAWKDPIDLSQTVGWFTTMFPVQVARDQLTDATSAIHAVRDCIREIPRNGWSYFSSRYHNEEGRKSFATGPVELNFNYIGAFQQLEKSTSLFQNVELPPQCDPPNVSPVNALSVIDVSALFVDRCLTLDFRFDKRVKHVELVKSWARLYEQLLRETVQIL